MRDEVETYLGQLARELKRRGVVEARIVEEARGHLADAMEDARRQGLSAEGAQRQALTRFGAPEVVAADFLEGRIAMSNRLTAVLATLVGLAIAYVDSRPRWDDAGITAGSMLVSAGLFGLIAPQRPWLWALAVGIWIPAYAFVRTWSVGSLGLLVVLAFPFAGAYLGMAVRRALAWM